jgi:glycosyltransferase involved in cell wall biosynthesis
VKYAGNWQPSEKANRTLWAMQNIPQAEIPIKKTWRSWRALREIKKEPWSYKLQRWWLQKGLHKGIVTVNGIWPNQPKHVYTFPNPCLTQAELSEGQIAAHLKTLKQPIQLLFIGRLEEAKGAGRTLEIASLLASAGIDFQLNMIGDGPAKKSYEYMIKNFGLSEKVELLGWLPKNELADYYAQAHFSLLPSASEGWPKVLSEGMAYGVVPLAGAVSSIPQILEESGAGLALPPDQPQAFAQAIQAYLDNPQSWQAASQAGVFNAEKFSYAHYLRLLKQTAMHAWQLPLREVEPELSS